MSADPRITEWGNPHGVIRAPGQVNEIACGGNTV